MANENTKKKFRFNIVDAIIIVLLICVVIFAVRFFSDGNGGATVQETYLLTFYGEEVADYVIPNTEIGDTVYDFDDKLTLGKVTDIKTDESQTYIEDSSGKVHLGPKENYSSVYITVEVLGTRTENGVIVGGVLYSVGHSVVLYAGDGKYFLKTYSIEPVL